MPTVAASLPNAWIKDASIHGSANIAGTKIQHRFPISYQQASGTAVVAATVEAFIAMAAGTLVQMEAMVTGAIATGADRHVVVDLQKSTGAGAFATVLSATIDLDNGSVLRTAEQATISSTSFVDGDAFRWVVTVSGAAGNQAQGLLVTLYVNQEGA